MRKYMVRRQSYRKKTEKKEILTADQSPNDTETVRVTDRRDTGKQNAMDFKPSES